MIAKQTKPRPAEISSSDKLCKSFGRGIPFIAKESPDCSGNILSLNSYMSSRRLDSSSASLLLQSSLQKDYG